MDADSLKTAEEVFELAVFLHSILTWLASPSVRPIVGLLAAVGAAILVVPGEWLRRPKKALVRSALIGVAWLVIVFLVGQLWPGGPEGEDDAGPGSIGDKGSRKSVVAKTEDGTGGALPELPEGGPSSASTTVHIRFFPSPESPEMALNATCRLIDLKSGEKWDIRGSNRPSFHLKLQKQLGELATSVGSSPQVVEIDGAPYPGRGTIKQIKTDVRNAFAKAGVKVDFLIGPTTTAPSQPKP
jgi:hypothetical protein